MSRARILSLLSLLSIAVVVVSSPGCGPEEEESFDEHLCGHVGELSTETAATAVDPASTTEAIEPILHTIWGVDLLAGLSYVQVDVADDVTARLAVDVPGVVVGLLNDAGEDQLPAAASNELCPDDIEEFTVELTAGTWHIEFQAAEAGEQWLLLFPEEDDGHDEHDH
ncbi:MAG: hypothetical protein GY898_31715 [Proteobacteria bacterium]|nr:hypothetical protein [Pseudomonadota bacterium]